MAKRNRDGGLVYSTEFGRACPGCSQPVDQCVCDQDAVPEGDGIVRISRETKGRKGKGVTLVKGVLLPASELKQLAKQLKQRCGTGGALKDGVIEIQGDQRELLKQELVQRGFQVKLAGG
ncbi:translation initiation factor Sui1 [Motiliproteus sp.]|uniref:translation initiation factor Sui1 n=1 Tax=Motiliproteus sp. TaxID=1898955 RepID=UPI003BAC5CEA